MLEFETVGDFKDFRIKLNKELLMTEGHELIGKLLYTLQVYKSSASYDRAKKLYDDYSSVSDHFLKYRDIVISKKRPGTLHSYPNMVLNEKKKTSLSEIE